MLSHFLYIDFFPTCQVRVVRFYVRCAAPRTSSPSSSFLLPPSSFLATSSFLISSFLLLAGSHLPALDRSGPRRTSPASSWSQWGSPGFNRRGSERCGHCRTSTGEGLSAVGLAGLQPARVGAPWASPDFNRRGSERCGPRRSSTGQIRRAVGLAWLQRTLTGPQRPETKPYRMSEDLADRMSEDMTDRMPDRYAR